MLMDLRRAILIVRMIICMINLFLLIEALSMLKLQVRKELIKEKEHNLSNSRCTKSPCSAWMAFLIKEAKKLRNNEMIKIKLNLH